MKKLRAQLKRYQFQGQTPALLDDLAYVAHRTDDEDAAEAWFLLARGHLDWFIHADLHQQAKSMWSLLGSLHLPRTCCRPNCLAQSCRGQVLDRLSKEFRHAADRESGSSGYGGLSRKLLRLIAYLRNPNDANAQQDLADLVPQRDPAGSRASLLVAVRGSRLHGRTGGEPPERAIALLTRSIPGPCADARKRPEANLNIKLSMSHCDYPCRQLPKRVSMSTRNGSDSTADGTRSPVAMAKLVRSTCPFETQGMSRMADLALWSAPVFVAAHRMRTIAQALRTLSEQRTDPLLHLERGLVAMVVPLASSLRVPCPYPRVTNWSFDPSFVQKRQQAYEAERPGRRPHHAPPNHHIKDQSVPGQWLEIPSVARTQTLTAPVAVILQGSDWRVCVQPTWIIDHQRTILLGTKKGLSFPGTAVSPPGRVRGVGQSLEALVTKARAVARACLPGRWNNRAVALFASRSTSFALLRRAFDGLASLHVPQVQIVVTAGDRTAAAGAVHVAIGCPPGTVRTCSDTKPFQKPQGATAHPCRISRANGQNLESMVQHLSEKGTSACWPSGIPRGGLRRSKKGS
ncbi:MAG: hypothetical protein J7M25_03010 [Deltaproteobacteria bacterium]|nr:hypothetical protein [Deltaproteobacteria bacterium]